MRTVDERHERPSNRYRRACFLQAVGSQSCEVRRFVLAPKSVQVTDGGFMFTFPELSDKLISRLSTKTGMSKPEVEKLLAALADVVKEDEPTHNSLAASPELATQFFAKYDALPGDIPTHVISIPVVEHADGSIAIDRSSYSAWTPLTKPITVPRPKTNWDDQERPPIKEPPGNPAEKPERGSRGGYPGPSVFIKVNDWLENDFNLTADALGKFHTVLESLDIDQKKFLG